MHLHIIMFWFLIISHPSSVIKACFSWQGMKNWTPPKRKIINYTVLIKRLIRSVYNAKFEIQLRELGNNLIVIIITIIIIIIIIYHIFRIRICISKRNYHDMNKCFN